MSERTLCTRVALGSHSNILDVNYNTQLPSDYHGGGLEIHEDFHGSVGMCPVSQVVSEPVWNRGGKWEKPMETLVGV